MTSDNDELIQTIIELEWIVTRKRANANITRPVIIMYKYFNSLRSDHIWYELKQTRVKIENVRRVAFHRSVRSVLLNGKKN